MTAEVLVSRLDKCMEVGRNRWKACCPAHDDRSPSLSIEEKDDGRVLIHCFAGCGAVDVLDAVGLDYGALYPPDSHYTPLKRKAIVETEDKWILELARSARKSGKKLTAAEKAREQQAFMRLRANG